MTAPDRLILIDDAIDGTGSAARQAAEHQAYETEQVLRLLPHTTLEVIRDHGELLRDPQTTVQRVEAVPGLPADRRMIAGGIAALLAMTSHGKYLSHADVVYDRLDDDAAYQRHLAELHRRSRPAHFDADPLRRAIAVSALGMVATIYLEHRTADAPSSGEVA